MSAIVCWRSSCSNSVRVKKGMSAMGTAYINERCRKILTLLLMAEDYIPLQQLAKETGVSKRSVYYDLCKVNEWLAEQGISELEVVRGKGILISEKDKSLINEVIDQKEVEESYVFSPSERVKIIYCYILIMHLSEKVYIDKIAEYCQVSRNTIFNDMRAVVAQLQEYNLTLVYEKKKGYKISGDVVRIRALFFMYFNALYPLFEAGLLDFLYQEPIREHYEKIQAIAEELNTKYVKGVLFALASLVPLMYKGARRPYFPNLNMDKLLPTPEYQIVQRYFPDLDEKEHIYLCLHLLGSRVAEPVIDEIFDNQADQSVYEISKALVSEFEKTACIEFEEKEELERSLFLHINSSMYRYQYGIQIGNPLSDDIIREYPNLFDITKSASKYLEQMIGLPIPDSEIAYLALHFGSHMKIAEHPEDHLRILIVCVNGVSTGNMLKREIQKLLPYAEIIDVVAAVDLLNVHEQCDLIISTVKLKSIVPVIVVRPILTDYDRKAILNHRLIEKQKKTTDVTELFEVVRKYVDEEDYDNLKKDLAKYIQGESVKRQISDGNRKTGLAEFLAKDRIRIEKETYSWQDAIRKSGEMLLEAGSIERCYLDNIISQIQYYGPYMFITKGIVLAHGKPEDGANRLDVSMTVFEKPVHFTEFYDAQIIIMLAVEDQEKHLKILRDIMNLFEEHNGLHEITQKCVNNEILAYIEQTLQEENKTY